MREISYKLNLSIFFFFEDPYIYIYNQRFENEKWSERKTFIFTSSFFKAGNRVFFFFNKILVTRGERKRDCCM